MKDPGLTDDYIRARLTGIGVAITLFCGAAIARHWPTAPLWMLLIGPATNAAIDLGRLLWTWGQWRRWLRGAP